MKNCVACGVQLTDQNWKLASQKNWVNKCVECLRLEKREYQRKWSENNRELAVARTREYKKRLAANDPVKLRAMHAYNDAKKRAARMNWEFDLTPAFVLELMRQSVLCPYLGLALTHNGKAKTLASLDRKDSSKGYTQNNVWVVSYLANLMKSYATDEELNAFAVGVLRLGDVANDSALVYGDAIGASVIGN